MSEPLQIIEFDIDSLKSNKYPQGAIFIIRIKDEEISLKAEPSTDKITLSYQQHGKVSQGYESQILSIKEIAEKFQFTKKVKIDLPPPRLKNTKQK